jgi:hypothetical protein
MTLRRPIILPVLIGMLAASSVSAASFPATVALPDGFAPEGIAIGRGTTFYTGSLVGAGIWRGDLRTGQGEPLVEGGGPFTGMKVDQRGRLWVAGGPSGGGYLFDASSGDALATFSFATGATFINDVVVTGEAAYFTDSLQPAIYRVPIATDGSVGAPTTLQLDPSAIGFVPGEFNLNGIDATADGRTLLAVSLITGGLFTIDAESGAVQEIAVSGTELTQADGILLAGRTLFVARNVLNLVVELRLAPDLSSATLAGTITSADFAIPTTLARFGTALYAVNARFDVPQEPETAFWITRVDP